MISFDLKIEEKDNISTIYLKGELDIHNSKSLDDTLQKLQNRNKIILNMKEMQYIDSTGLGTIAKNAKLLAKTNGEIIIHNSPSRVRKIFEISGLHKKNINLVDSEESVN